jgi:UDP-2,3-diacylglucosamine pyrophosphatase LpxH|tara:strand:+ start:64 stop:738 length:675 start_codon:yes stop_codon:yes gene_type:complete
VKKDYVRLIISDLHLGSANAKESLLCDFLTGIEFDELVLAGDIIDFIKVPSFTEKTIEFINILQKKGKPIVYVIGNHDINLSEFAERTISGVKFVDKYEFEYSGKKYKIMHGHQFDTGIVTWRFSMKIISIFQDMIERWLKWDMATWLVKQKLKKRKLRRIWDILKWNKTADVFIMGHTHIPEAVIWIDEEEKIKTYVNTGDWVEHQTYVMIKDGQLRLKKFQI